MATEKDDDTCTRIFNIGSSTEKDDDKDDSVPDDVENEDEADDAERDETVDSASTDSSSQTGSGDNPPLIVLTKEQKKLAQLQKRLARQAVDFERHVKNHKATLLKYKTKMAAEKDKQRRKRKKIDEAGNPLPKRSGGLWVSALTEASRQLGLKYTVFPSGSEGYDLAKEVLKKLQADKKQT